jgi:hypothetical protein
MHRLIFILSIALLSGCMEVNEPDRMIYPVRKRFLVEDPFSKGYGIEVGLDKIGDGALALTYIEPDRINNFSDTQTNRIDLWIIRTPTLRSSKGVAEEVDLRFHMFTADSESTNVAVRTSEMRIWSKGSANIWRADLQSPLSWKTYPGPKKGVRFEIPDTLLGSSPVLAWFVVRTIDGKEVMIPPLPSLCILDEESFKKQIY